MNVNIFAGEYTYSQALVLLKAHGLTHNDMVHDGIDMRQIIAEGKLPVGEYWFPNGCNPGDDMLKCFAIRLQRPDWVRSVTGPLAKLKVAVIVK